MDLITIVIVVIVVVVLAGISYYLLRMRAKPDLEANRMHPNSYGYNQPVEVEGQVVDDVANHGPRAEPAELHLGNVNDEGAVFY